MRTRAISLTNRIRRDQIATEFTIDHELLPLFHFIFELTETSPHQQDLINKIAKLTNMEILTVQEDTFLLAFPDIIDIKDWLNYHSAEDPEIDSFLNRLVQFRGNNLKPHWKWRERELDFRPGPAIMGILNVTPDSFSDGGRFIEVSKAVDHALTMAEEGARIIDIGGESTRPGADPVSAAEEMERIIPVIKNIRKQSDVLISVDTYKSTVAESALASGADLVNDISGATFDKNMTNVVKKFDCPLIIMHIKGKPRDMQKNPHYTNATKEILFYLEDRLTQLAGHGISKIIIDPGIGFGKRVTDNLELIRNLEDFIFLGHPLMIGTSRKSFIGHLLNKEAEDRLTGTLATVHAGLYHGADIIRVHDVSSVKELLTIYKAIEFGMIEN